MEEMRNGSREKKGQRLQTSTLQELQAEYPQVWDAVQQDVDRMVAAGSAVDLNGYLQSLSAQGGLLAKRFQQSGDDRIAAEMLLHQVKSRMAYLMVKRHYVAVATGVEEGKAKFNLVNGLLAQFLLFSGSGLERKPVSMGLFRLLWPLIGQKRLLMPLVQPKGIYCFYSKQLVDSLASAIGSRKCLEIAAGDGTLTRFLAGAGVRIVATDDYSWGDQVQYPEWVVRQEAAEALKAHAPEVVVCSWPPAGNPFEKQVFRSKSVQMYIVIGSRHRFAAGNWEAYQSQTAFSFQEDGGLSALVLPPELDAAVYIFRRRSDAA